MKWWLSIRRLEDNEEPYEDSSQGKYPYWDYHFESYLTKEEVKEIQKIITSWKKTK